MTSKTAMRRERQLEALIGAAENKIKAHGLAGVKARHLADEIGVALGAIYNLVADLDELILRVNVRTMKRLDAVLLEAAPRSPASTRDDASNRLVAIALAYRRFATDNLALWRGIFEYRLPPDRELPEWAAGMDAHLFRHISRPLRVLMPRASDENRYLMARTLFSAVHGVVSFGLEDWQVGVPANQQDAQIETLLRLVCAGLS